MDDGRVSGFGLWIAVVVCAVALALSSCAYEMQQAEEEWALEGDPRQRAIEAGEYVLVYRDAAFYEVPGDERRSHRAYEEDRQDAAQPFERRVLAKAVADHGDFVEVERIPEAESLVCDSRGFHRSARVTLRFFVPRDDLALAVRHRTSRLYDDGTEVELLPGVAVEPDDSRGVGYRAWHAGLDFAADVSPKDVGLGFSPTEPWKEPRSGRWVELDDRATVGDASLVTGAEESLEVVAEKVDSRRGRTRVRIQRDCARVTASVPDDAVGSWGGWGRVAACAGLPDGVSRRSYLVAAPETPVYWPDGEEAGLVTRKIEIPAEGPPADARLCRELTLMGGVADDDGGASEEARRVEYCFDRQDLDFVDRRLHEVQVREVEEDEVYDYRNPQER